MDEMLAYPPHRMNKLRLLDPLFTQESHTLTVPKVSELPVQVSSISMVNFCPDLLLHSFIHEMHDGHSLFPNFQQPNSWRGKSKDRASSKSSCPGLCADYRSLGGIYTGGLKRKGHHFHSSSNMKQERPMCEPTETTPQVHSGPGLNCSTWRAEGVVLGANTVFSEVCQWAARSISKCWEGTETLFWPASLSAN